MTRDEQRSARPPSRSSTVNPWLQLATLFGLFGGGGLLGLALASWAAPGSGVAAAISGPLLPIAFVAGLLLWSGLEFVVVVAARIRGRHREPLFDLAPRSRIWFVALSVGLAAPGGLIVGLLPDGAGVIASTLAYAAVGLLYGAATGRLAATGHLPGPFRD